MRRKRLLASGAGNFHLPQLGKQGLAGPISIATFWEYTSKISYITQSRFVSFKSMNRPARERFSHSPQWMPASAAENLRDGFYPQITIQLCSSGILPPPSAALAAAHRPILVNFESAGAKGASIADNRRCLASDLSGRSHGTGTPSPHIGGERRPASCRGPSLRHCARRPKYCGGGSTQS